mmetsp:Transcript_10426/g.31880  ORF Transcript_10426/g.31880 Transcript_10426/m.31880 type:complete len:345 (-) Transcript_10426:647-1681(-)
MCVHAARFSLGAVVLLHLLGNCNHSVGLVSNKRGRQKVLWPNTWVQVVERNVDRRPKTGNIGTLQACGLQPLCRQASHLVAKLHSGFAVHPSAVLALHLLGDLGEQLVSLLDLILNQLLWARAAGNPHVVEVSLEPFSEVHLQDGYLLVVKISQVSLQGLLQVGPLPLERLSVTKVAGKLLILLDGQVDKLVAGASKGLNDASPKDLLTKLLHILLYVSYCLLDALFTLVRCNDLLLGRRVHLCCPAQNLPQVARAIRKLVRASALLKVGVLEQIVVGCGLQQPLPKLTNLRVHLLGEQVSVRKHHKLELKQVRQPGRHKSRRTCDRPKCHLEVTHNCGDGVLP